MKCGHGVDQNISYCGRCEWKRAEAARIWGQALEVQNERLERETRSVGKDIALSEAKKRISELEAERESWGNEFSAVITMKERITELELANNRLRKTWREDTEDLAKIRVAHRRELEKQAERVSELEKCLGMFVAIYDDQGKGAMVCLDRWRFDEARTILKGTRQTSKEAKQQAECVSHLERALADATKAGTPFWKERDTMNAHVVENARLREALERSRYWFPNPWDVDDTLDSAEQRDRRRADYNFVDSVLKRTRQVCKECQGKGAVAAYTGVQDEGSGAKESVLEPCPTCVEPPKHTVQATTEEAAAEAERKLGWDKPAVQDTGGQRCVCGHRGLWHEQSRRYIICESPGCECLQFTPIVTARASNPEEHARNCIYDGTSWACAPACQVAQRPVQDCSCPDRHRTLGDCLVDHCGAATESDAECVHGNVISERVCPECTAQACNHPPVVSSNYPGFDCERCGIGPAPAAQGTDRAGTGYPPGVDRATTGGSGNKTEPAEPDGDK